METEAPGQATLDEVVTSNDVGDQTATKADAAEADTADADMPAGEAESGEVAGADPEEV